MPESCRICGRADRAGGEDHAAARARADRPALDREVDADRALAARPLADAHAAHVRAS
jgi:hypothetical protein